MQGKLAEVTVGLAAHRKIGIWTGASFLEHSDGGISAYVTICGTAVCATA